MDKARYGFISWFLWCVIPVAAIMAPIVWIAHGQEAERRSCVDKGHVPVMDGWGNVVCVMRANDVHPK